MSFRVDLMKETVTWAEKLDEYGSKATIRLDDKSQQTGTVAGVFLAAALGFLKPDSLGGLGAKAKLLVASLLFIGVIVLVGCVGACLSVTWLRLNPVPIALSVLKGFADDVVEHKEDQLDDDIKVNLYRDRLRIWQDVLDERVKLNKSKAWRLKVAQSLLVSGVFVISILLFTVIWSMVRGNV
jgi:hypothetical protein